MLRIVQNRNAAAAKSYYAQADYYLEGQELTGHWGGNGAERLGLAGEVQRADFESLCDNLHPQTGEQLTPRTRHNRTVGYDFNFHCPKGVSLVYALTQDERLLEAFRTSVAETMKELEAEVKTRVRRRGRDEERAASGLCWAEFVHFTARPVEGIADPHLHAHCFVMNSTFDEKEQRWKAAQFRELKRDAPYFEAAFYARFARRMNELGYPVERRGKAWDIAAIPRTLTDRFSRRTKLIERMAEEQGVLQAEQKGELGAKTREKKRKELGLAELRTVWRERLTDSERALLSSLRTEPIPAFVVEQHAAERALDYAVGHCFERHSVVPEKHLLAEALRHGIGQVQVEELRNAFSRRDLVAGEYRGRAMVTTHEVIAEERAMLAFARKGRNSESPLHPEWNISREWLSAGQQAAVQQVLQSPDRVQLIRGRAGTGKTSLMKEAVEGIEAGGRQVFTFAPSAEASRGVLKGEGFENATTVAQLLVDERLQKETAGNVIWIDEAGLLGTRTLKQVFDIAQKQDCRVILSGDWKQHAAVERGAALRLLEQEAGLKAASVTENRRQESMEYRAIVDLIADDQLEAGLDRLEKVGWVREAPDAERNQLLAQDYADCVQEKESVLAVCPTRAEGERLSECIRAELKARGMIAKEEQAVLRLEPRHLTEAERSDAAAYAPGDVLVFHQNSKGFRRGERIRVTERLTPELSAAAKSFQVFRESSMNLAVGDTVRITRNGNTADGKHRLNNGATYTITEFTPEGDLRLNNGWLVAKDFGFLSTGYVLTSHSSQGKTVDRVLIAEPTQSFGAASREQWYVSLSRGKRSARVYTDSKQALRAAIHRSADRLSATELVSGGRNEPELQRLLAARAKILAAQKEGQRERDWEYLYGG